MPSRTKETTPVAQQQVLVPEGFPKYMRYQPGADTIEFHTQVGNLLGGLDQKLRTSNHLQAHQLAADFLMPLLALTQQWQLCTQRDMLQHTHDLAEFLASENVGGMDEAFGEMVNGHLEALDELLNLVAPLTSMGGVAEFAALDAGQLEQKQAQLSTVIERVKVSGGEIHEAVATALADEDEEEEEEEEGEAEDGDGVLFDDDEEGEE